jgi:hypothetical protein
VSEGESLAGRDDEWVDLVGEPIDLTPFGPPTEPWVAPEPAPVNAFEQLMRESYSQVGRNAEERRTVPPRSRGAVLSQRAQLPSG